MRAPRGDVIVLLMATLAVCTLASYYSLVKRDSGIPSGIVMDENRFAG